MSLLRSLVSAVTGVEIFPTNYNNVENQLLVKIGETIYTCSAKLSSLVRDKKVQLNQLGNYEVREVIGKDGKAFKSLGLVGEGINVSFTGWAEPVATVNSVSLESFTKATTIAELEKLAAV
jgi:hypothetical protein